MSSEALIPGDDGLDVYGGVAIGAVAGYLVCRPDQARKYARMVVPSLPV
jgi:hypothetical protein